MWDKPWYVCRFIVYSDLMLSILQATNSRNIQFDTVILNTKRHSKWTSPPWLRILCCWMSFDDVMRWHEDRGQALACLGLVLLSIYGFVHLNSSCYHLCPVAHAYRMIDGIIARLFQGHFCFHKTNSRSSMCTHVPYRCKCTGVCGGSSDIGILVTVKQGFVHHVLMFYTELCFTLFSLMMNQWCYQNWTWILLNVEESPTGVLFIFIFIFIYIYYFILLLFVLFLFILLLFVLLYFIFIYLLHFT